MPVAGNFREAGMGVSFALLSVAPSWERGAGEMQGTDY